MPKKTCRRLFSWIWRTSHIQYDVQSEKKNKHTLIKSIDDKDDDLLTTYFKRNRVNKVTNRILVWNVAIIHPSLNIEFPKESSLFWFFDIQFSRKLWFDTIEFAYPTPTFEGVLFLLQLRWFIELFNMTIPFEWVLSYIYR